MPTIRHKGLSLHYEVTGDGPPIVLGHSFLCSGEMWGPQIGPLSVRHQVLNLDLRGHGQSSVPTEDFDLYDLVDDVLAVLDQHRIERAVWGGLSIGGMTALRAALVARERVSALMLLDTDAGSETPLNKVRSLLMGTAARVVGTRPLVPEIVRMFFSRHTRRTRPELVREWADRIASVPLATVLRIASALRTRDSLIGRLPEIAVPALVLVGTEDAALPPRLSRTIAAALPRASFVEIENASHLTTLEQPEAATRAMLAFLDQLDADASSDPSRVGPA